MELLLLLLLVCVSTPVLMPALASSAPALERSDTAATGLNLQGKMFTLYKEWLTRISPALYTIPYITTTPYTTTPTTTTATTTTTPTTTTPATTTVRTTTATTTFPTTTPTPTRGLNLQGKMFTLSKERLTLFSPALYTIPYITTTPYTTAPTTTTATTTTTPTTTTPTTTTPTTTTPTTTPATTTATTTFPTTTPTPTRGVSVCLRYVAEANQQIFTLSYGSYSQMTLVSASNGYTLSVPYRGASTTFRSFLPYWFVRQDPWTSMCVTMDTVKDVAQLFNNGAISVRKRMRVGYVWTGPPVIDIWNFEGQITDVHVWDYPLSYREVENYMNYSFYSGSVLNWSRISYYGYSLLEDVFSYQQSRPMGKSLGEKMREKMLQRKMKWLLSSNRDVKKRETWR